MRLRWRALAPPWGAVALPSRSAYRMRRMRRAGILCGGAKLVLVDGRRRQDHAGGVEGGCCAQRTRHPLGDAGGGFGLAGDASAVRFTSPQNSPRSARSRAKRGSAFHMDGARFANAVAALGCAPADITWRAGVDVLSFGATKNGAMAAEAIVCFDLDARRGDRAPAQARRASVVQGPLSWRRRCWLILRMISGCDWRGAPTRMARAWAKRRRRYLSHAGGDPTSSSSSRAPEALAKLRAAGAEFYDWGNAQAARRAWWCRGTRARADIDAMAKALTSLR